jgi:prophage antirepressor-like protein
MILINESGLYNLIFVSRKPEAKKFKRWITKDVLPQIRKTGMYVAPSEEIEKIKILKEEVKALNIQFTNNATYMDWQEKKYALNAWFKKQKGNASKGIHSLFPDENDIEDSEFQEV